jgi:TPR repeat protein
MTEQGEGVAKDEAAAVRIYKQAADLGDARGETNLARMTLLGHGGLVADRAEALRLYKLAAQQGEETAQKSLKQLGETW